MDAELWNRVESICHEALLRPAHERSEYLEETCGEDQDLHRLVQTLIAADARAGSFLKEPLLAEGVLRDPESWFVGRRLGRWELVRKIGEGGMSIVFEAARCDDAFHQLVAVKLLRRGFASSSEVLLRFRTERQILASLNHPSIARLLDGGTTEDGSPYVVMERIDGEPIDIHCHRRGSSLEERLRLFIRVCEAVRYAHRKLVIHRDLKPSNILVTPQGDPKLLDFGIAKLVEPELYAAEPARTITGQWLLTPQYASPEQLRGETVTTASDVYSLGVILYRLLAGCPPCRIGTLSAREVLEALETQSIPRPSVVARTEGFRRRLRGDLDNILLKALEPDERRRYGSPGELAADLSRHLEGRPVAAREGTRFYRWGKLLRRHRLKVAVAATFLVLVLGFPVLLWLQVERTVVERDRAEESVRFLEGILTVADPLSQQGLGVETSLGDILDRAVLQVDGLGGQPELQARLRVLVARIHGRLGLYDRAESLYRDAVAAQRGSPESLQHVDLLNEWARVSIQLGRYEQADHLYHEALATARRLGDNPRQVAVSLSGLGMLASMREELPLAETRLREALALQRQIEDGTTVELAETLESLGGVLGAMGRYAEAEERLKDALALFRQIHGDEHPQTAITLTQLGVMLFDMGEVERAEPVLRESLRIKEARLGPHHSSVLNTLNTLAVLKGQQGDLPGAVALHRDLLVRYRRSFEDSHPDVIRALHNLASALRRVGEYAEAEAFSRRALALARTSLGERNPNLAFHLIGLARIHLEVGNPRAALPLFREALDIRRGHLHAGHWRLAESKSLLGACLLALGRREEAEVLLDSGWRELRRARGEEDPEVLAARERLAMLGG